MITNATSTISAGPVAAGTSVTVNRLPVSAKYHQRLLDRVARIVENLKLRDEFRRIVIKLIDRYITTGTYDRDLGAGYVESLIIFLSLKDEIDSAMARSRRAREIAAARREAKNRDMEAATITVTAEAIEPAEPTHPAASAELPTRSAHGEDRQPRGKASSSDRTRFNLRKKTATSARRHSHPYKTHTRPQTSYRHTR